MCFDEIKARFLHFQGEWDILKQYRYLHGGTVMYKIVTKKILNPTVTLMEVEAPLVAKRQSPVSLSY